MQEITSITSYPNQRFQIVLENNETVDFKLYYSSRMRAWYYDFVYKNIECKGNKVCLTPNTLRQFHKIIPFGIAFVGEGNIEPFRLDDFESGRTKFYVLNKDEVRNVEKEIFNS